MDSESLSRMKYESARCDMLIIADKLGRLAGPLYDVRLRIDGLLADADDELKERLENAGNAADRCVSAVNDLLGITAPYSDSGNGK